MHWLAVRIHVSVFLLAFLGTSSAPLPRVEQDIPGLNKILGGESVLTTSIQDAVTEVPFLDDFDPPAARPMTALPRTSQGGFILERPGNYLFECQSYCLDAGTYAPGEGRGGNGYLYAPWKGPQADIIRNILRKSYLHSEISQEDVQTLLWAVIARTRIRDLSNEIKLAAAKLLTPGEILKVNGGALGLIAERVMDRILDRLPPIVRQIIEAQARLRELLTQAEASYEELESVAVLTGEPPFEEGDREIPLGRWSLHPHGYFIRYFPRGYDSMLIELNMPKALKVEKDPKGRIVLIADGEGNRLEAEYEDSLEPLSLEGQPDLKGYAFKTLRFERPDGQNFGKKLKMQIDRTGWTFVGLADGEVKSLTASPIFSDMKTRTARAVNHTQALKQLIAGLGKLNGAKDGTSVSTGQIADILGFFHISLALENVLGQDRPDAEEWAAATLGLARRGWMSAVSRTLCPPQGQIVFDPTDDPVPGQAASQRGGDSGRETENGKDCSEQLSRDYDGAMEDFNNQLDSIMHDYEIECDTEKLSDCVMDLFETDMDPSAYIDCFFAACHGLKADIAALDIYEAMAILYVRLNLIRDEYEECMRGL
jgi:hypothetical protein